MVLLLFFSNVKISITKKCFNKTANMFESAGLIIVHSLFRTFITSLNENYYMRFTKRILFFINTNNSLFKFDFKNLMFIYEILIIIVEINMRVQTLSKVLSDK